MARVRPTLELRLVRRVNLLVIDAVPANLIEPRVVLEGLNTTLHIAKTLGRVFDKQSLEEVTSRLTQEGVVELRYSELDVSVEGLSVL
jgi:hypothetical protein